MLLVVVVFGEMTLFVVFCLFLLFCQLASNPGKKYDRMELSKKPHFLLLSYFLKALLLFPVDVVQDYYILSCSVLHEVELAFSGFVSSVTLVQIKFIIVLCCCVYVFCLFTLFILFLNAEAGRKRGEASRGDYLLRGGWETIFLLFVISEGVD